MGKFGHLREELSLIFSCRISSEPPAVDLSPFLCLLVLVLRPEEGRRQGWLSEAGGAFDLESGHLGSILALALTTCVAKDLNPLRLSFLVLLSWFVLLFFISKMIPVTGRIEILAK